MELLDKLNTQFPLKELPVGEFREFKIKGMTFTVRQYEAAGLGHVSWTIAAGIELMDTLAGPCELKPLDEVKARYASLPDHDLGSHWYDPIKLEQSVSKRGKKALSASFDALTDAYFDAYMACAGEAASCAPQEKAQKTGVYVEGLLLHGGPSTDVLKKGLGEEKTADLFRNVLFG